MVHITTIIYGLLNPTKRHSILQGPMKNPMIHIPQIRSANSSGWKSALPHSFVNCFLTWNSKRNLFKLEFHEKNIKIPKKIHIFHCNPILSSPSPENAMWPTCPACSGRRVVSCCDCWRCSARAAPRPTLWPAASKCGWRGWRGARNRGRRGRSGEGWDVPLGIFPILDDLNWTQIKKARRLTRKHEGLDLGPLLYDIWYGWVKNYDDQI